MEETKIYLVGKTPPPIGGVTVHVQRLLYYLKKMDIDVIHLSIINSIKLLTKKKIVNNEIVHLHTSRTLVRLLLLIICKISSRKLIVTYHSYRNKKSFQILFDRFISKNSYKNITVGEDLLLQLKSLGFSKLHLSSPFIPPTDEEVSIILNDNLIFRNVKKVLIINAYSLIKENNKDIYGVDITLQFMSKYSNEMNLGLYIALGDIGDRIYYNKIQQYILEHNLSNRVKIIIGERLIPILKVSDIFLRPTLEDSFGVSIAEALYFNKVAIASNVCKRPKGTLVYNTTSEFENLLLKVIKNKYFEIEGNVKFEQSEIINLYK